MRSGSTVRVRIRFSVWLFSGYAHCFPLTLSLSRLGLEAVTSAETKRTLDVDFCDGVGASTRKERLRRVNSHVVDRLVKLFPMHGQLLDAGLRLDVPQPHRTVVAWQQNRSKWDSRPIKSVTKLFVTSSYSAVILVKRVYAVKELRKRTKRATKYTAKNKKVNRLVRTYCQWERRDR